MKNRKLLVLLGIVVILIGAGLLSRDKNESSLEVEADLKLLIADKLEKTDIDRIEISVPEAVDKKDKKTPASGQSLSNLNFIKLDGTWRLTNKYNAPAKPKEIENFISALFSLEGEFRSESSEVLPDYGLDTAGAMSIRLFKGKDQAPAWEVLVGKRADYRTHFVRLAGSSTVYSVDRDLRSRVGASTTNLNQPPDYKHFIDMKIVKAVPSQIRKVKVETALYEFELEKAEVKPEDKDAASDEAKPAKPQSVWVVAGNTMNLKLKAKGADNLVKAIIGLSASDIAGETAGRDMANAGLDLDSGARKITLIRFDGKEHVLWVSAGSGKEDGSGQEYFVRVSDEPLYYKTSTFNVDEILVRQNRLFDLSILSVDPGSVSQVSITGPEGFTIRRAENQDKWVLEGMKDDEELIGPPIDKMIKAFNSVEAYGLAFKQTDFKETARLIITTKDGTRHEIALGDGKVAGDLSVIKTGAFGGPLLFQNHLVKRLFLKRTEIVSKK